MSLFGIEKAEVAEILDGKGKWGGFFVAGAVTLILISTASIAFSTMEELYVDYPQLFSSIEIFCVLIFTIEYFLRIWVADNVFSYIIQPMAILDLLSILPTWLDFFVAGDQFPAFQFLRMLRIFKFLATSERGSAASKAFSVSWKVNKGLVYAACIAGGAVWLVTASLQYFAERHNPDMDWCYPPAHADKHIDCTCDDDGCDGDDCECVKRFGSIPSAMFFVLLNLSGEFPLADNHSTLGRFICVGTAIISVAVFAIPTGLIGAALEDAVGALNAGDDADYDVDEEDVAEIAAEALAAEEAEERAVESPNWLLSLTKRKWYKQVFGILIVISTFTSLLATMRSMPYEAIFGFFVVDCFISLFFFYDQAIIILSQGPDESMKRMFRNILPLADTLAWLPTVLRLCSGAVRCPYYIWLGVALFRMIKWERYSRSFQILARVIVKSEGVLAIGGMAAACCLVFCSTLMYYAERNNPDPNMSKYYSSVPTAMWITLLNLSGEAPLCDYTLGGRLVVGFLSLVAVAIFGIPVGALGAGFEDVISELSAADDEDEEDNANSAAGGGEEGSAEEKQSLTSSSAYHQPKGNYSSVPVIKDESQVPERYHAQPTAMQRLVDGRGFRGKQFLLISVIVTLLGVAVEVVSTCEFAQSTEWGTWAVAALETAVVIWFTFEYIVRASAHGLSYVFSWFGAIDFLCTFPWYVARGILGPQLAVIFDQYDGPLRALRLLRLVRLDEYAPSLSLIDDAVRNCWRGLSIACYAGVVLWFTFNIGLYFSERDDADQGEDKRFRSALSSAQYSGVLLTGDYPIADFSIAGRFLCTCAVIVAVGIVAVPASVLAGAFVDILQEEAEEARQKRKEAAMALEKLFLSHKARGAKGGGGGGGGMGALHAVVREAITKSAILRGLDNPNWIAKMCLWKNGKSQSAALFHTTAAWLVFLNVLAVVLESVPFIENGLPHAVWQTFEAVSVIFFSVEYLLNILTAVYDPIYNFNRWNFASSFVGMADLISILPFYVQTIILPLVAPGVFFDATIFRIFRLARILNYEAFSSQFLLLSEVFVKAGPVLQATGVVALIVWIGGATIFYYVEPHDDALAEAAGAGGEDAQVFTSIADSMYYTSIFLAGEWAAIDFTPAGAVLCTIMALVGVALFSIPVGVLFEGFQDKLIEAHGADAKKAE